MSRMIFVNLPVQDLQQSIEFFTQLGFKFNPQFTNENATCMIVSDDIFVMLLVEKFFKTFTPKDISDASRSSEVIITLSTDSREEVDQLVDKAMQAGAHKSAPAQDQGFMYVRGFQDLDGHLWEIMYMDAGAIQ
jgi:uncharacterized protein